ncbi:MAG: hypothetical protein MRERV_66c005 [Mycoplasmataceae bacterium RV_VA103A]|nr:MAG: hypothetical protein MRERV_66c005 [Mycoplasmataceae bacterium RV_VA103A]
MNPWITNLINNSGFTELKEWFKEQDDTFKKNLEDSMAKNLNPLEQTIAKKLWKKLLPEITKELNNLSTKDFSRSDCYIIAQLIESLSQNKKLVSYLAKQAKKMPAVEDSDLEPIKAENFCWTRGRNFHHNCLPLNQALFSQLLELNGWPGTENITPSWQHFLSSLPTILNKTITNRRIEYIKSKLEKSNIQAKELEDYLNQKLFGNNYSDWENQVRSGSISTSYLIDLIEKVVARKNFIQLHWPEIYLENQDEKGNTFLAPKEIELLLEETRNTSEHGLEEFFPTREARDERRNLKSIIKKRKEFANLKKRIEQMVLNEDFYEEEIKSLIVRLKKLIDWNKLEKSLKLGNLDRAFWMASSSFGLISGKEIIIPINAKDVYLLVKDLEEKLTTEPTEEGESLEEFTLRRLTEILEVNVEAKLTENSKKILDKIRSDRQAKITPNQQANLRKDIKEQFINHLQKLIEDNQIAREDLSEKTKRIFENDRRKWPFDKFENVPKITEEIYQEIKLLIPRGTENLVAEIQIKYWHDLAKN